MLPSDKEGYNTELPAHMKDRVLTREGVWQSIHGVDAAQDEANDSDSDSDSDSSSDDSSDDDESGDDSKDPADAVDKYPAGWLSAYSKLDLGAIKSHVAGLATAAASEPAAAEAVAAEDLPENWF